MWPYMQTAKKKDLLYNAKISHVDVEKEPKNLKADLLLYTCQSHVYAKKERKIFKADVLLYTYHQ